MSLSDKTIKNLPFLFPHDTFTLHNDWSKLTTIGVGKGKIITSEPSSEQNLIKILQHTHKHEIPVLPLAAGSNTIGTDIDYHALIIKLNVNDFKKIEIKDDKIICGSGVSLLELIKTCAKQNLGGMSQLAGIPGILGGSLRTNAGRLGVSIFEFIKKLEGYKLDGTYWETEISELYWSYRNSDLPENVIVTKAHLQLVPEKRENILKKIDHYINERTNGYPKSRSAGCIFKNPLSGHGAGKLIDISGCKGLSVKSLHVSTDHANFIVNNAVSTENDFLELAKSVRSKVFDKTGIYLKPEVFFANRNSYETLINTPKQLSVLIFKGGSCRERPVSLDSAANVSKALKEAGYNVTEFDIKVPELPKESENADVIFPVLHGGFGEDGTIQKLMEQKGFAFVGCGSKASGISIDKVENKKVFNALKLNTPKDCVINETETDFPKNMSLPVVVKPPQEGSTFGITIVHKKEEWLPALKKASIDPTKKIIIEEYIDNIELTAGVFNGKALPLVHIVYPGEMYDYDAKYTHQTGETLYISPPEEKIVSLEIQKEIQKGAEKVYNTINAKHLIRIDILLDKKTKIPYFLEINNLPGFTSSSLFPKAAAAIDIPYIQVCALLVKYAYEDHVKMRPEK